MAMFAILPWCRIDRDCRVGDVAIIPWCREAPIEGAGDAVRSQLARVLACYSDIEGHPVSQAAIARFGERPLGEDLDPGEIEVVYEAVQLACFAGLASRQFFVPDAPCNSDVFILHMQRQDEPDFVAIRTRRRDGNTWNAWSLNRLHFTVPPHVSPIDRVPLDGPLLEGLVAFGGASASDWARWQHALSCFNQANTDSETVRYQVEWGLLCSAFERLLDAKPDYEDVAARFTRTLVPSQSAMAIAARRRIPRWSDQNAPLRSEWLKEFYRVRGDFAHGRLETRQPMAWQPNEHLVLAAIAFPLLVRSLLRGAGLYELTHDDQGAIEAFEDFADRPFFERPPDPQGSMDSWWSRSFREAKGKITRQRAIRELGPVLERLAEQGDTTEQ